MTIFRILVWMIFVHPQRKMGSDQGAQKKNIEETGGLR